MLKEREQSQVPPHPERTFSPDEVAERLFQQEVTDITSGLPISSGEELFSVIYTFLLGTPSIPPISRFPIMALRQPNGSTKVMLLTGSHGKTDHHTLWRKLGSPPTSEIAFTSSIESILFSQDPSIRRYLQITNPTTTDPSPFRALVIGGGSDYPSFPVLTHDGAELLKKIFAVPGITPHGI